MLAPTYIMLNLLFPKALPRPLTVILHLVVFIFKLHFGENFIFIFGSITQLLKHVNSILANSKLHFYPSETKTSVNTDMGADFLPDAKLKSTVIASLFDINMTKIIVDVCKT